MFQASHTTPDAQGRTVVTLKGEAGILALETLEREMIRISASQPRVLVFDLSGLTFAASIAIGNLVAVRNSVHQRGGRCFIAGAQGDIAHVLHRSRVDGLFEMVASVDDAIAATAG